MNGLELCQDSCLWRAWVGADDTLGWKVAVQQE